MAAGLPGTGIGGLFFILSAFFMVVVELQRTIRGRSSVARWRLVGRHAGIAAAMVAAVTAVVWLLHRALYPSPTTTGKGSATTTHALMPFAPVLITLAVLAAVLLTAYLAQFVVRREAGPDRRIADGRASEPEHRTARAAQRRPVTTMLQRCTHAGCTTLCLGPVCITHDRRRASSSFTRGRPWPPVTSPARGRTRT